MGSRPAPLSLVDGYDAKRHRKDERPYDTELYKERNIIQRFFSKPIQFAVSHKLLVNFMAFVMSQTASSYGIEIC